jgi:hypothetical protein
VSFALTPEQDRIAEWLTKEAPQLGELYRAALLLLTDENFPGRVHLISHAARDIANRVPEIIAGREQLPRVELTDELDQLTDLWSQNGFDRTTLPEGMGNQGAATTKHDVPIPVELFRHLQTLISRHAQVAQKNRDKATKMIEAVARENAGRQDSLVPLARQWVELARWFQRLAHGGLKNAAVDEHELQAKFRSLETYLYTLIGEFYEGVEKLDAILEDTNS